MQFSTLTLALTAALTSTITSASPLAIRDTCAAAPTAASGSQQPIATPAATTAAACQAQCDSNQSCQSFVFGVAADGSTVQCLLYAVPAAQVPTQSGGSFQVFDKACTGVPSTAPTTTTTDSGSSSSGAGTTGTGSNTGTGQTGQTGTDQAGTSQTSSGGQQPAGQGQKEKRDVCGSAPTGPSTQAANPVNTMANVNTAEDCLTLGKQTAGTQSVEFGKTSATAQNVCLLFNVPVSQLPAPTEGQSLVAFDVAC